MKNNPFRIFWMNLGLLCLGLGTIGVILPILPTVPFYMVTVFCFGHSYGYYGDWLCSHEQGACGKRVPGHSLGVPCPVFLPEGEDR